jgi:hypothetical protein
MVKANKMLLVWFFFFDIDSISLADKRFNIQTFTAIDVQNVSYVVSKNIIRYRFFQPNIQFNNIFVLNLKFLQISLPNNTVIRRTERNRPFTVFTDDNNVGGITLTGKYNVNGCL